MSLLRRVLDYFHLASYPASPRVKPGPFRAGLNLHIDAGHLEWMGRAGFRVALFDWLPEYPAELYDELFGKANAAGLEVFITGLPQEGIIDEHARNLLGRHGHQITYLAVRNEPDLAKFYTGTIEQLSGDIKAVWAEKTVRAPHVKIVAPCVSSLGSSSRLGPENVIRGLGKLGSPQFVDVIGQHIYRDTPDATMRYLDKILRVYREAGWTQPMFVSEFGWRHPRQRRQATYLANTRAMLSRHPDVMGAAIYVNKDDGSDTFGIHKADGTPKAAVAALEAAPE